MIQSDPVVITDELVQAACQGVPSAFAELWQRCHPIIQQSIAKTRGTRGVEPAEVAQEAALVLLGLLQNVAQPAASVDASPASFADNFRRQLQFRIRTYLRAEHRRAFRNVSTSLTWIESELSRRASPGAPAAPGRSGRAVARALERLTPRQRAVVNGLYFEDQNVNSVANNLGVSHQAVTALHRRSLVVLREAMGLTEFEKPPDDHST